jgi:hypothetical protein
MIYGLSYRSLDENKSYEDIITNKPKTEEMYLFNQTVEDAPKKEESDKIIQTKETSNTGKVYKTSEKEAFKTDMYNAYYSALTAKGIQNAEEFAKRLVVQDILESR